MKIGPIYSGLLNEGLDKSIIKKLKDNNKGTLPKIPVERVFYHALPDMSSILQITKKASNDIEKNKAKGFSREKVNVKMIVPTQKNLNLDNIISTENVGDDTKAELVKEGQFYFVVDGHHRIANAILQGIDEIYANVYHN